MMPTKKMAVHESPPSDAWAAAWLRRNLRRRAAEATAPGFDDGSGTNVLGSGSGGSLGGTLGDGGGGGTR